MHTRTWWARAHALPHAYANAHAHADTHAHAYARTRSCTHLHLVLVIRRCVQYELLDRRKMYERCTRAKIPTPEYTVYDSTRDVLVRRRHQP